MYRKLGSTGDVCGTTALQLPAKRMICPSTTVGSLST
jgi:hypothetical protein